MKAITVQEANDLRNDVKESPVNNRPRGTQFGIVEIIPATGRATCRVCGKKISKGSKAVKFMWDFTGSGSWTLIECQIHLEDCIPAETIKPHFYSHEQLVIETK